MGPSGTVSSLAAAAPIPDPADPSTTWYGGNIQYLLNISAIGAICCLLLFVLVKLRSDHRLFPGPSALLDKLFVVYHARIALHCGADTVQFLHIERSSFFILLSLSLHALLSLSLHALLPALPLNLYAGTAPILDDFARTTITHIPTGSPLLWAHFLFMVLVALIAQFGISKMEEKLKITCFQDGDVAATANSSSSCSNSIAIFTIMVQGIPKSLATDKASLEEYFQHRYPGKVYRLVIPFDHCTLEDLAAKWTCTK